MKDKLKTAIITMWGHDVAAVSCSDEGYAVFEYTEAFQRAGLNISPVTMPVTGAKTGTSPYHARYTFNELALETYMGLPGLLADALPGSFAHSLIEEWLIRQGRPDDRFTAIAWLCYLADRGIGALEFTSAGDHKKLNHQSYDKAVPLNIEELVSLLQTLIQDRGQMQLSLSDEEDKASEAALTDILRIATSAGGAQPKALIALSENNKQILSGQADIPDDYDYWLLKFDGVDDIKSGTSQNTRIEYAYALMARAAGIDISECRLLEENERAHFITRRFDRIRQHAPDSILEESSGHTSEQITGQTSKQSHVTKLHMQSLSGLAHFDFNQSGTYRYEQAFSVMREMRLPKSAALELYKRMLFNVFARNQNDNTKNIAFLMNEKGQWKLAPAFNLTYSHDAESMRTSQHQMSINGKRDNFTRKDLMAVGENLSLPKPDRIIDEVKQAVSQWYVFAKRAGVKKKTMSNIAKMHRMDI